LLLHVGGLYLPIGIGILHENEWKNIDQIINALLVQFKHIFEMLKNQVNINLE
jgi:hypothetical protein